MFANAAISDIIATTIQSRSGINADNVTKNNALLTYITNRGNSKPISGGNVIMQELAFAENTNASYYSGYEVLPIGVQDVISAAQYPIKQASVAVTISGLEQLMNAGKERMIDLLEERIFVAEASLANLLAQGIYADGTGFGGKEIDGLREQVVIAPTNTVGGIDRNVWEFWRNKKFQATVDGGGATTATGATTGILLYMNQLWGKLVRSMDRPDLIVMDNAYWQFFTSATQANQRFARSDKANVGFTTLQFMDADVVLDGGIGGNITSKTLYMLNTKYLMWRPHKDRNMTSLGGKRVSVNQDASVQHIAWAGNLTSNGLQFQGVMQE